MWTAWIHYEKSTIRKLPVYEFIDTTKENCRFNKEMPIFIAYEIFAKMLEKNLD